MWGVSSAPTPAFDFWRSTIRVSNPSTLSASSPEFQSLMQQMPLMTAGVILGLIGLLFYLPQYYSLQFGRIDPLRAITRRQLQREPLGPSPKSWNHERVPQQSLGARSNLDWLVLLELLHARCHRLLYHALLYQLPNCLLWSNQADQTRAAPFYRPSKPWNWIR